MSSASTTQSTRLIRIQSPSPSIMKRLNQFTTTASVLQPWEVSHGFAPSQAPLKFLLLVVFGVISLAMLSAPTKMIRVLPQV